QGKGLPDEPRHLALLLCGRRGPEFWGDRGDDMPLDFYDLKGVIEALTADLYLTDVTYRPAKVAALHPGRAAEVVVAGRAAGWFGELHPKVAEAFGLAGQPVQVAELDLEVLRAAVPACHLYRPVSEYPPALRDVAVVVEGTVPAERVEAEVRAAGGELLRDVPT